MLIEIYISNMNYIIKTTDIKKEHIFKHIKNNYMD